VSTNLCLSLNAFLTNYGEDLPSLSAKVAAKDAKELVNIWRKRINQEISASNRFNLSLISL
jgi:hypothetical protein